MDELKEKILNTVADMPANRTGFYPLEGFTTDQANELLQLIREKDSINLFEIINKNRDLFIEFHKY